MFESVSLLFPNFYLFKISLATSIPVSIDACNGAEKAFIVCLNRGKLWQYSKTNSLWYFIGLLLIETVDKIASYNDQLDNPDKSL